MLGLVGGGLLVMGLISFGRTLASAGKRKGTDSWPVVAGVITASSVETRNATGISVQVPGITRKRPPRGHVPRLQYTYRVGARDFTGHRVSTAQTGYSLQAMAAAVVSRYPVGAAVRVAYDPADPSSSVLEVEGSGLVRDLVVAGLLAAVGAAIALLSAVLG